MPAVPGDMLFVIKFDNFARIYLIFDHSWSILICPSSEMVLALYFFPDFDQLSLLYFFPAVFIFLVHFWSWFFACLILFVFACLSLYACLKVCCYNFLLFLFYCYFFGGYMGLIFIN